MTAQAGERLIFKGEETWMAAEPLNQFLQNRNDIKFKSPSTACWRGYYGQWEIKEGKLYLIGLKAYIEGYKEVGLNYLFPGNDVVFANWFSGKIRIPQGELLDYVHMGYASLYEKDMILVFEGGVLINEYIVDNEAEYYDRLEKKEEQKYIQLEKVIDKKKKDKVFTVIATSTLVLLLIGTCIGVYNLILLHTTLAYLFSTIIIIPLLLILGGITSFIYYNGKESQKADKAISFIGINFLLFVFIGICIGIFYLIKWGTILAYFISGIIVIGLLFLTFLAIRNRKKHEV